LYQRAQEQAAASGQRAPATTAGAASSYDEEEVGDDEVVDEPQGHSAFMADAEAHVKQPARHPDADASWEAVDRACRRSVDRPRFASGNGRRGPRRREGISTRWSDGAQQRHEYWVAQSRRRTSRNTRKAGVRPRSAEETRCGEYSPRAHREHPVHAAL